MLMSKEETFGPVAAIQTFATEDEGVATANDTPFGLSGYFYSRDIGRVWRVAEALETGIVGVNTGLISTEVAPFGGIKESGSAARAPSMGSTTGWRSSTYASAASAPEHGRDAAVIVDEPPR
jgi:succinate-semialdehyde dehydrogenase/glutarate-semialdehyde dehydrogenase